jgi:membrane-associated phospholipid phosphatase
MIVSGMMTLYVYGKGLPMSPFPPRRYVTKGIYGFIPHPIYTGFSIFCIGISIAVGSASGLWFVSPVVILCCAALVLGFEKHDLRWRFGPLKKKVYLHLAEGEETAPDLSDRLSVYFLVFLPWLILYEAVLLIGIPPDAVIAFFPFEQEMPVLEWTEIFYISTYPFVLFVPWAIKTKRDLRKFSISGLISTGIIVFLFLIIPLIAPPRPFTPNGLLGELLLWERKLDTPACAFPSFHVVWALLAASFYTKAIPSLRILWWGWAILIAVSCMTTGMHAIIDILAGLVVFGFVIHFERVWEWIRLFMERIANSWEEWRWGPIRLINHGIYAGISALVGVSMAGFLLGHEHISSILVVSLFSIVMAGLFGQFVEGSSKLLRPFGYYGSVIGFVLGSLIAKQMGTDIWLLFAGFSVAAPWIQGIGRLRCLVQGCCHGKMAPATIGIRYVHIRSRVTWIAELSGIPIHPTPLYSILWNIVVGVVLARFWSLQAQPPMIGGLYLILAGFGRFVEEAYRGEPQTLIIGGLKLYQWLAIGSVIAGAVTVTFHSSSALPAPEFHWEAILAALGIGGFAVFAYGIDFPNSNKRFSRLV